MTAQATPQPDIPQSAISNQQSNILVVEDSAIEAELLRRSLARAGYRVSVAKNGAEGLQMARANPPALVVSDINMPVMTGYQLCHEIKYDDELWNVPVILLTVLTETKDIMQAINAGADGYAIKPFVEASLLERISALLATPILRKRSEERRSEKVEYEGEPFTLVGGSQQILNLLLSVYKSILTQNREMTKIQDQLSQLNESLGDQVKVRTVALSRVNRTLHNLRSCNQLLVRASDEPQLLDDICQLLVNEGGYRMAWVGYAEQDEAKTIRPVAHAGYEEGYLERQVFTWSDAGPGRHPCGEAIRSSFPCIRNDIATDPRCAPFRAEAEQLGYASAAAFPLVTKGEAFGALMLFSSETNAFNEEEARLLSELADDLTFGITALRARLNLARTDEELRTINQELDLRVSKRTVELQKSNETLRLQGEILHNLSEGIILVRASDGIIMETNPKFDALFGYQPGELAGKPISVVNAPVKDDPEATAGKIAKALNASGEWHGEIRNIRKDGAPFWCRANVSTFNHPGYGKVWVSVHSDISEQKQAEEMKVQLFSTVSHELRTPLSSLRGFVELMLMRDYPEEKRRQFLQIIAAESQRLGRLLDEFLDIQRMEAGRQDYHFEPVVLPGLVQELVQQFGVTDPTHTWQTELEEGLPAVNADRERLRQVLENLITNAQKFSPEGGEIAIGARLAKEEVVMWVRDQGMGIPEDELPKLFVKFYRIQTPQHQAVRGTGLGLALVRDIVEAHHGRLWVDSKEGEGSSFYISLPVA